MRQGKTHTLSGNASDLGIIPRAIAHLFDFLQSTSAIEYLVRVSYVEIYNENVFDLVHFQQKSLPVKWDATYGFYVQVRRRRR